MRADDPEFDCTDAAHPAWWRGYDYGTAAMIREVNAVLDGAPLEGTCTEPWEELRRRILACVRERDALLSEKYDSPSCMEAEHGGHPTCPHMEEVAAHLRSEVSRLEAKKDTQASIIIELHALIERGKEASQQQRSDYAALSEQHRVLYHETVPAITADRDSLAARLEALEMAARDAAALLEIDVAIDIGSVTRRGVAERLRSALAPPTTTEEVTPL